MYMTKISIIQLRQSWISTFKDKIKRWMIQKKRSMYTDGYKETSNANRQQEDVEPSLKSK